MKDFVHLHLHTQYSLLDGAADICRTLDRAARLGMKSVAITDHGVMYGAIEFYEAELKRGIKPIIGCEVYTAPKSRFDKDARTGKNYGHLVLLCKNENGYRNLMKLVTHGHTEGFYYKPRIDMSLLKCYSDGLIALSGCLRGDVPTALLNGGYAAAKSKAEEYIAIFGKENFYLEIQNHGLDDEQKVREGLAKLSDELGLGLVATNDVHYTDREDALLQDVLTCIQTGKKLSDTDRLRMETDDYYFKDEDEMKSLFADFPEAIENTHKIAERCNLTIDTSTLHLPEIEIDSDKDHRQYLYDLCMDGMKKKYHCVTDELTERLSYELDTINKMGYIDYFLIVHDFIKHSKTNGISVGPGRGSAAGSIVSYCLDITEIDPIKYNLIFERFLNPERVSMPDIDIDFCYKRRDEVRNYVSDKYGERRVAQIITFGTLAARAAIKDVGRVMGITLSVTDKVSKSVPRVLNIKLSDAIKQSAELSEMYRSDADIRRMLDIAMKLEGFPRNASTHAAGVVIGDDDLTNYVPLQLCDTGLITQYPMASLEKIGLLKMDFLGLRNLTVIDDCVTLAKEKYGVEIDMNNIDLCDSKTFDLIRKGDTDGVFQLENPGLQTFLRRFKPKCLEDIITTTSIYRPGPMEQIPRFLQNVASPDKITYAHPLLKEILEPTFGVVIYQEQVMKIVRTLAGYSLGRADLVRRAMAKKKHDVMEKEREIFLHGLEENGTLVVEGAVRRGVDEKCANGIFDSLIDFANYAFNKSHAACYALLAYKTAYLKAHMPDCYLAAVLKNYAGHTNKAVKYIASFAKYGIKVLPPDVNKSHAHFFPEDGNVRFGLCWIRNVGDRFPQSISEEREKNGLFTSLDDFIKRMASSEMNKRSVESLIRCGCFDSIYPNRRVLLYNCERLIDIHQTISRTMGEGQLDWFSVMDSPSDGETELLSENISDFDQSEKLGYEYEYAGMYFSGHPLDSYRLKIQAFSDYTAAQICDTPEFDGKRISICGRITALSSRRTKSGRFLTSMTLSDFSGECPVIAFESSMQQYKSVVYDGAAVCMTANISFSDEEKGAELIMVSAVPLDNLQIGEDKSLYIRVESKNEFENLKPVFKKFPGKSNLYVYFSDTSTLVCSDLSNRISISDELGELMIEKLGEENVKIK